MRHQKITVDGNEAATPVAYKTNEMISIYPITPSSPMGESADEWTAGKHKNIWGMIVALKANLRDRRDNDARDLLALRDSLVRKSVWIIGGDGWAYDIGYSGLDHVLASGQNVNGL